MFLLDFIERFVGFVTFISHNNDNNMNALFLFCFCTLNKYNIDTHMIRSQLTPEVKSSIDCWSIVELKHQVIVIVRNY